MSAFTVSASGQLSGGPTSLPSGAYAHPGGRFAYGHALRGDSARKVIDGYEIARDRGLPQFTPMPGGPFPTGATLDLENYYDFAFDPAGRFLYVVGGESAFGQSNPTGFVAVYRLDNTTGVPTPVGRVATNVGASGSNAIFFSPNGRFAYVHSGDGGQPATAFSVNANTGLLTKLEEPAVPLVALAKPAVHPSGRWLVDVPRDSSSFGGGVDVVPMDPDTGALGPQRFVAINRVPPPAQPPFYTPRIARAVFAPSGRHLYFAATDDSPGSVTRGVLAYSFDAATGALAPVPGSPFASDLTLAQTLGISPAGDVLLVCNRPFGAGSVSTYRVDATTGAVGPRISSVSASDPFECRLGS